jgi:hypothetical protein
MVMSLMTIALTLLIAYLWSARGFFSALLFFACTLVSGAIAFAAFEPLGLLLINSTDSGWVTDIAWGGSLAGSFLVSLLVTSLVVNVLVRKNLKLDVAADWVGGALCGLGAGVICSGFAALGISMVRAPYSTFAFTPVTFDNGGSLTRTDNLLLPVDMIVAKLYKHTSTHSMAASRPLAVLRPHIAEEGHLLRAADTEETLLKYSLQPKDMSLLGRYTVGQNTTVPFADLVGHKKNVLRVDGTREGDPAYIEGYVVKFNAGAKESQGQVVLGVGSATLVVEGPDGTVLSLQPVALVSQGRGDTVEIGRWTLDAKGVFIGSVGGASDATFGLEFAVPRVGDGGYQPVALYVRGVRFDLRDGDGKVTAPGGSFASAAEREAAVFSGAILRVGGAGASAGALVGTGTQLRAEPSQLANLGIMNGATIPTQIVLDSGQTRGGVYDGNALVTANITIAPREASQNASVDRSLRVDRFQGSSGTSIISVDASKGKALSLLGELAGDATGAPALIDANGQRYEAVGYVYRTNSEVRIVFDPGKPIRNKDDFPALSRSRDDQVLWMVFRPSYGVKIEKFVIGNQVIAEFKPSLEAGN